MLHWGTSFHLVNINMVPLVYFEQRCQQIGPVMVCILYAQDRSPGTLLDQTPRRENKRSGRGGQDKKRSKKFMAQQQRHFPKLDLYLPVCRISICRAGLLFCIPGKVHCLKHTTLKANQSSSNCKWFEPDKTRAPRRGKDSKGKSSKNLNFSGVLEI